MLEGNGRDIRTNGSPFLLFALALTCFPDSFIGKRFLARFRIEHRLADIAQAWCERNRNITDDVFFVFFFLGLLYICKGIRCAETQVKYMIHLSKDQGIGFGHAV